MKFKYIITSALLLLTLTACSDENEQDKSENESEILTLDSVDKSEYAEIKFSKLENVEKTPEYIKIGDKYIYLDEINTNVKDNNLNYASNTFYNFLYEYKLKNILEKEFTSYFEAIINSLPEEELQELLKNTELLNVTYYNTLTEYLENYLRLETFDKAEREKITQNLKVENSTLTNFYYVLLLENTEENKKLAENIIQNITDEKSFSEAVNKYKDSSDIQVGSKFLTAYSAQNALKDVTKQEINSVKFYTDSETLSTKEEVQMFIKVYERVDLTDEQFNSLVDDYILENYTVTTTDLFKKVSDYYDDVEISEELIKFYDKSYLDSFEKVEGESNE